MSELAVSGGRVDAASQPGALTITPDYVDEYTLTTDIVASGLQWLVACIENGVKRSDRDLIFERICGLQTEPDRTPGTVAGWRVARDQDRSATIEAVGPRMSVNLVMECLPGGVRLTTAVQYRSKIGSLIWRVCSYEHRRQAPRVLRTGAATV